MPPEDREPTLEDLMSDPVDQEVADDTDDDMEGIDPDHPVLSIEDQRKARDEARAAITKERKDAAMKSFIEKEKRRLKTEEGLVTGSAVDDEIVEILIDLAPFADRIVVNEHPFFQGHTYRVARHVARSLAEQQARTWEHQLEIDGKNLGDRYRNAQIRNMKPEAVLRGKAA